MNAQEIASVAAGAGFSGDALRIAVAIALAESGGNPGAHNPVWPDDSYGLWQINMIGSLGPKRRAMFGLASNSDLFDPAVNARVAYAISGGGSNFNDWATFNPRNGTTPKYLAYLPAAVPSVPSGMVTGPDSSSSDLPGLIDPETVTQESGLLSGIPVAALIAGAIGLYYLSK